MSSVENKMRNRCRENGIKTPGLGDCNDSLTVLDQGHHRTVDRMNLNNVRGWIDFSLGGIVQ